MKTFTIDGDRFSTLDEFWDEVQRVLTDDFKGFGRNLDAFNDILRGGFGRFEYGENIKVIWRNSSKSRRDLGFPETVRYRKKNLTRVHPLNISSAKEWLEKAEKGQGPTMFDIFMEIIAGNENVKLELA